MTIRESQTSSRSNVETGVPGLDEILGGGLVRGGVYLLEGMAGAGKTILSSQIGFHRVSKGEKVLYMTLIAESHDKLLAHLEDRGVLAHAIAPGVVRFVTHHGAA